MLLDQAWAPAWVSLAPMHPEVFSELENRFTERSPEGSLRFPRWRDKNLYPFRCVHLLRFSHAPSSKVYLRRERVVFLEGNPKAHIFRQSF